MPGTAGPQVHYQLWRNMIFSEWMASEDHPKTKAFHVNLVRKGFEKASAAEFHGLLNPDFNDRFRRLTWESIYRVLREESSLVEAVPLHGNQDRSACAGIPPELGDEMTKKQSSKTPVVQKRDYPYMDRWFTIGHRIFKVVERSIRSWRDQQPVPDSKSRLTLFSMMRHSHSASTCMPRPTEFLSLPQNTWMKFRDCSNTNCPWGCSSPSKTLGIVRRR